MNKKLLLVGVLALSPAITFGQNKSAKNALLDAANQLAAQQLAGNNPAAAAPAATPTNPATPTTAAPAGALTAPPAGGVPAAAAPAGPDPSRVQDGGPLHVDIKKVDPQGNIWFITGDLVSNEDTDIKLVKSFYKDAGGTSVGGNPGLGFTSVTLGDAPDHNAPVISAVSGTSYKFTLQLDTQDGAPTGLQELRMLVVTKEGNSIIHFKNLKADAPDTQQIADPGTGTAAAATAGGTDPNAASAPGAGIAAPGAVPAAASSAASAVGAPGAPGANGATNGATSGTPAAGTPVPAAAQLAPAAVVAGGPTAADKAAQADINAEAAALTAKHWNIARGDIAALQAIQRNGVKGTRLSPAMATAVNNAINNGLAQIAAAPKNTPKKK